MTSGGSNFNDFPENQLTHLLGEMPGVGVQTDLPEWVGFQSPS